MKIALPLGILILAFIGCAKKPPYTESDVSSFIQPGINLEAIVQRFGPPIVDDKLGWAALQYDPKFAKQSGFTSIILNGDEVGRIDSSKISGLEWSHDSLRILIAPDLEK